MASIFLKIQALDSWAVVLDIGEQGGVPLCLEILSDPAIATTAVSSDLREFAAWLLSQLVSGAWSQKQHEPGDRINVNGKQAIFDAGGITILAEVLESSSGYLQSHAAWVVACMANGPQISEQMSSTSIPGRLLQLAMKLDSSDDVPTRAAWAIAELAESSSASRKAIVDLGTIMQFTSSLADAQEHHDVHTATALTALASLALHSPAAAAGSFEQLTPWQITVGLKSSLLEVRAQAVRFVTNIAMANGTMKRQFLDSTSCMSSLSKLVHDASSRVRNQAARALFTLASV